MAAGNIDLSDIRVKTQPHQPILERLSHATLIHLVQSISELKHWYESKYHHHENEPNLLKTYPCRPTLPIRYDDFSFHAGSKKNAKEKKESWPNP